MQPISNLIRKPAKVEGANSERAELIGYFTDQINKERQGTKFKQLTYRYIGVKLSHLSNFELYAFKKICDEYRGRGKSFSRCFFGALKFKPTDL